MRPICTKLLLIAAAAASAPTGAHPVGGAGGLGWPSVLPPQPPPGLMANGEGWREGKIDTASHAAGGEAAAQLGHGPAAITFDPGAPTSGSDEATFGAAVIDQLARAGYATAPAAPDAQTVELVVTHNLIRPAEPPRSPIGGAVEVDTTGSRTLTGLALSIDLTKPRKALIATRLEARIRNNETHAVLWEGYASVIVALT